MLGFTSEACDSVSCLRSGHEDLSSFLFSESERVSHSAMSDSLRPHGLETPGSSVRGILQIRILESVAIPSSRGSSGPKDQTRVSCIAGSFFTI